MKYHFTELKSNFQYCPDIYFIIKAILNCPLCIYSIAIFTEVTCNVGVVALVVCVNFFCLTLFFLKVALNLASKTARDQNLNTENTDCCCPHTFPFYFKTEFKREI